MSERYASIPRFLICLSLGGAFFAAFSVKATAAEPAIPAVKPDTPEALAAAERVKRGFQFLPNKDATEIRTDKRNNIFFVGEQVTFELGPTADRYEVRDYQGDVVDQGRTSASIRCKVTQPGWYKLYVFVKPPKAEVVKKVDPLDNLFDGPAKVSAEKEKDKKASSLWGDIVGTSTFVIFRDDPNFPKPPSIDTPGGPVGSGDEIGRGILGMGPQRHSASADKVDETIANLGAEIALDKKYYLPFDPVRKRVLMIAFPGGTKNLEGVRKIVEHFKDDVLYWEPRNEPNYGSSPQDFVEKELKPFYETVKSVDPKLRVLGPGTVSYNDGLLPWIEGFLKAGGAKYVDAFSMHAYNCVNGDLYLARRTLVTLDAMLKKYDAGHLEKWQTEQGYFACVYGAYQPRIQGRWTMVEMMMYEQFGIPKEHNHLWYDRSHGFWDFPTWWQNNDGTLNPAAPLMRVFSEELFGKKFTKAYDFGPSGNNLYVGSLFEGPAGRVAAFQSAGSPDGKITLKVGSGNTLRIVSAFGVESDLSVTDGKATLLVPELPVYVRLTAAQTLDVEPFNWGDNLARSAGTVASASGSAVHPSNKPDDPAEKRINNDVAKVINGELENWYRTLNKNDQPWMSNVAEFPGWVQIQFAKPTEVSRVVIYAAPPWQLQSTLLDYELQVEKDGKWVTIEHVKEPTKTFKVFSPATRTVVDSFFSDRWVFQHQFAPVTTSKIRLLVHDVTHGGGATAAVGEAGGQTGLRQIVLREVEIYGK